MTISNRPQILYVGFFRLPDLNAAAQRVMANAKVFRSLGYDVILAEVGDGSGQGGPIERLPDHDGFKCYRLPMRESSVFDHPRLAIRQIRQLLSSMDNPRAVIAYNYPALALARLAAHCRRRNFMCAADVTEWYGTVGLPLGVVRMAKWVDTELRMRVLHKRLDALVVISKYLEDYYRTPKGPLVVKVPPLVDVNDTKWACGHARDTSKTLRLVYAGSPSAYKERLDVALDAVAEAAQTIPVQIDVVGITATQFSAMYPLAEEPNLDVVTFHGRVSHPEALSRVAQADFSVIARDRSRLTDAGFPTKFVESVTLGTPSIVTSHPDLSSILEDGRNGVIVALDGLAGELVRRHANSQVPMDTRMFDIRNFEAEFTVLTQAMERQQ